MRMWTRPPVKLRAGSSDRAPSYGPCGQALEKLALPHRLPTLGALAPTSSPLLQQRFMRTATAPTPTASQIAPSSQAIRLRNKPANSPGGSTRQSAKQQCCRHYRTMLPLSLRLPALASNHPSDCSSSSRSFRLSKSASNILKQGNNSGTVRIAAKAPWRLYTVRTAGGNAETPIWPPDPPARRSRQAPGRRRLWGIRPRDRNVPVVGCQMRPLPPPDAAGGELYGMRQCPDRHASPCSCWAGSVPSKSGSSSVSSRT